MRWLLGQKSGQLLIVHARVLLHGPDILVGLAVDIDFDLVASSVPSQFQSSEVTSLLPVAQNQLVRVRRAVRHVSDADRVIAGTAGHHIRGRFISGSKR